jgi:Tfp pilus assembly protein PilF/DNA-binding NarL/FixJ family response regulator
MTSELMMSESQGEFQKTRKPVVVVAETDKPLRETLARISKSYGWKPVEVSRGIHAWKVLTKAPVDAVIAGWDLPEINGLGLLSLVRSHYSLKDLPMVLIAKHLSRAEVLDAGRSGVSDIWLMPLSTEDYIAKVKTLFFTRDDDQMAQAKEMFDQGTELMEQGKLHEAVEVFERITETFDQAEVYYNMGYIKTAQAKYPEAITCFKKATELNQAYAQAYQKMGECYEKMGKPHRAQECFQMAASAYLEQEMDAESEEMMQQVLKLKPDTINIYNSLGIIYRKREDWKKAEALYIKALKVDPGDENIHYNLARVFFEAGKYHDAAKSVTQAIKLNSEFGHAKDLLAVIKKRLAG